MLAAPSMQSLAYRNLAASLPTSGMKRNAVSATKVEDKAAGILQHASDFYSELQKLIHILILIAVAILFFPLQSKRR